VRSFLGGDVFPRGGEVDGLAYPPHQPMDHSYQLRGLGLPVRYRPFPSSLIGGRACWEEETSWGVVI
jgi:hypothetical protein